MKTINSSILKKLKLPKRTSHKRDNGRLLIIAGSKKYHGALVFALKAASRIVDLTYVLTTPENQKTIQQMKAKVAGFIANDKIPFDDIDAVLIGPGLGISSSSKKLVGKILKSKIKAVLDADALNLIDDKLKRYLSPQHILTPHHQEFKKLFRLPPTAANAQKMMKKYNCTIVLKEHISFVCSPGQELWKNTTGNQGMTKGGTGDVLAGLTAAFFTKNNAFTSAASAVYANGTAGDELYKKVGSYYNTEDLVEQLPKTLHHLTK